MQENIIKFIQLTSRL